MTKNELNVIFEELTKDTNDSYQKTWSIMTEVAENNGTFNDELMYKVLENQQKIAADMNMIAVVLAERFKNEDV